MRVSVLSIWLLPAFCEDLTNAARSAANLSSAGKSVVTVAVWLTVVLLWVFAVRRFCQEEKTTISKSIVEHGHIASLDGEDYALVPLNADMREKVMHENRASRELRKMKEMAQ